MLLLKSPSTLALLSFLGFFTVAAVLFFIPVSTLASERPTLPTGSFYGYLTVEQTNEYMEEVHNFLSISSTKPFSIGTTNRGNQINALCIGACSRANAPQVLFTSLHHSREPMSLMALMYTIDYLVTNIESSAIKALLESRQLWFVPIVNPDGYKWNLAQGQGKKQRRKNMLPGCADASANGVDLNRNYATCWDGDTYCIRDQFGKDCGNSANMCAEDYRGTSSFSEPETRAIRDFVNLHSFTAALNYHSYGENLYAPYSCKKMKDTESNEAKAMFKRIAGEITALNSYKSGNVFDSLHYSAAGDASDWMYHVKGIVAFTPETGPNDAEAVLDGRNANYDLQDAYGFWPPADRVLYHGNKSTLANVRLAWLSGTVYSVRGSGTFEFKDGTMNITLSATIANDGLKSSKIEPVVTILQEEKGKTIFVNAQSRALSGTVHNAGSNTFSTTFNVQTPLDEKSIYMVVTDSEICSAFLISIESSSVSLVPAPLHLPKSVDLCQQYSQNSEGVKDLPSTETKTDDGKASDSVKKGTLALTILFYIAVTMSLLSGVIFLVLKFRERGKGYTELGHRSGLELGEFNSEPDAAFEKPFTDEENENKSRRTELV